MRAALLGSIAPWTATGMDDGLERELRARTTVEVVGLNMDRGVLVETFPEQWRCKQCGSIARTRDERCACGGRSRAQMQFVTYHNCGASGAPQLPRCPTHNAVAVRLPGTATARELRFFCPRCQRCADDWWLPLSALQLRQRRDAGDRPSRSRRFFAAVRRARQPARPC